MSQKINSLIIVLLFSLNFQVVEGQKHIIDSIEAELPELNDSLKVRMYIELSKLDCMGRIESPRKNDNACKLFGIMFFKRQTSSIIF